MSCYAVIDLEMCAVPKMQKRGQNAEPFPCKNEIIQIGALLLDESLEIADSFMTHVSPEYGVLDSFIEKLTGIHKSDLVGAPRIEEALTAFLNWMPEDCFVVSWSESDLKQIRAETEAKGLDIPGLAPYLENWIDCQLTFSEKMNNPRSYKLSEALMIADINLDEGEHDALIDARNTAYLFVKMQREDKLVLSPYFRSEEEEAKPMMNTPFAKLLANL